MSPESITLNPIGIVSSPYKEKFAIPRQPGLIEDGDGSIRIVSPYNKKEAFRDLEQFSHLWVLFIFHKTMEGGWHPTVRPPRLGGNARVGVFATRSTFRPNPIGLSLVRLKQIRFQGSDIYLDIASIDLLDGTPVLDIKPYLPFAENIPNAAAGFAQEPPEPVLEVAFSSSAERLLKKASQRYPHLRRFITQVLAQDPRPAYRKKGSDANDYAVHLLDFNIRWRVIDTNTYVFAIEYK